MLIMCNEISDLSDCGAFNSIGASINLILLQPKCAIGSSGCVSRYWATSSRSRDDSATKIHAKQQQHGYIGVARRCLWLVCAAVARSSIRVCVCELVLAYSTATAAIDDYFVYCYWSPE